tara:strand:- start:481 stop:1137 length:657 start_codon:yes stop_codon:yes gene_type:complete
MNLRIFVGHDSRYMDATKVCMQSIRNYYPNADITYLEKSKLKELGIYGREDVEGESTEFSFTRFYCPMIMHYEGISIFCDNDFLWKCDIKEVLDYLGGNAMAVVKHPEYEIQENKMDGAKNKNYPKKNWSSLMVFDNARMKSKLSKAYLDNASPAQLHEFHFINENRIGSIPLEYNSLVGHYDLKDAKALHYTNGGPWFEAWKETEASEEWWKVYNSL